ncbi:MAG TPA: hypothetical protein VLZ77_10220 [Acidimicrobiales bacterium]|nr:hypothetical protein [Acidimicrobiales bacterium]
MRMRVLAPVLVLGLVAAGAAACGSSGPSAGDSAAAHKRLFCAADVTLDKAAANATSAAGFLAVLKAHPSQLAAIKDNAPAGKAGSEARALAGAAQKAVADNNIDALNDPSLESAGGDIDTYCGVDGVGDPLPSYFAAGKTSAFCSASNSINNGTSDATGPADVLTFLKAHTSLLDQMASQLAALPAAVKADAQDLVNTARSAVSGNNADELGTQTVQSDSMTVNLYCGINQ